MLKVNVKNLDDSDESDENTDLKKKKKNRPAKLVEPLTAEKPEDPNRLYVRIDSGLRHQKSFGYISEASGESDSWHE